MNDIQIIIFIDIININYSFLRLFKNKLHIRIFHYKYILFHFNFIQIDWYIIIDFDKFYYFQFIVNIIYIDISMNFDINRKIHIFEYILQYHINLWFIIENNIHRKLIIENDLNIIKWKYIIQFHIYQIDIYWRYWRYWRYYYHRLNEDRSKYKYYY